MVSKSSWKLDAAEVDNTNGSCSTSAQEAVDQGAGVDVAADAGPARWQLLSRVPADGEGEG